VTGAADIGLTSLFDALERALVDLVVVLALGRANQLAKFVFEAFGEEIAFFLGNSFLQTKVRFDDEFGHARSPDLSAVPVDGMIRADRSRHSEAKVTHQLC
jgi:hypothetical protein